MERAELERAFCGSRCCVRPEGTRHLALLTALGAVRRPTQIDRICVHRKVIAEVSSGAQIGGSVGLGAEEGRSHNVNRPARRCATSSRGYRVSGDSAQTPRVPPPQPLPGVIRMTDNSHCHSDQQAGAGIMLGGYVGLRR